MTPAQQRAVMPMTKYWAIKQAAKKNAESFYNPWLLPFKMLTEALTAAASTLQHAVFFKEQQCAKPIPASST